MSRPDKCIWCGLHDVRNIDGEVYFACGSSCYDISGVWEQSTGCAEILELRKRVAAAVEASKAVPRYAMEADSHLAVLPLPDRQGDWVCCEDIDAVRDILQGNSPEISEGSP